MTLPDSILPMALCHAIYTNPKFFDEVIDNGAVFLGRKFIGGKCYLACRGSWTLGDWWRDLESIETAHHPVLGIVGRGFVAGIDDAFIKCSPELIPPTTEVVLAGHSLGAAHACYLAGLFIKAGCGKVTLRMYEPPRCCGPELLAMLDGVDLEAYRNREDPVTQVPRELQHPRPLIPLDCPGVTGDGEPLREHHSALILVGLVIREMGI